MLKLTDGRAMGKEVKGLRNNGAEIETSESRPGSIIFTTSVKHPGPQ